MGYNKGELMSKYPIYVMADDNEFYKNPIIKGHDFFICFDEDDLPELVIMKESRDPEQLADRASEIIKNLEIKARFLGKPELWTQRCFGDNYNFKDAFSTSLKISVPFSAEIITEHEGLYDGKSVAGGTFEYFDDDFDFEEWREEKLNDKK